MFEALELNRRVKRKAFKEAEEKLRADLLQAQFELAKRDFPVIAIVSGVEGAGKGTVVHRFNKWMDARLIDTYAFWDRSDEEEQRPFYWRFWRAMPAKGRLGVFFGSWYTRPIVDRALGRSTPDDFQRELERIRRLEYMLSVDGALIVKLWFHISKDTQKARLDADAEDRGKNLEIPRAAAKFAKSYDAFHAVSERAIRATDSQYAPWHLIEATDPRYRDLTAGETLLRALQQRLAQAPVAAPAEPEPPPAEAGQPTILSTVPLERQLTIDRYRRQLAHYQSELQTLAWRARRQQVSCVAVFEGWDAAGKGSAIRRVTEAVDPRLFRLVQFAAPTDEERAQHYLWRFWRQLAPDGRMTLFDRSWYGRVLVERVEGFATPEQWQRAYPEINAFEQQLAEHGSVVMKFWIHISQDEQLARFKLREKTPHKQHKITDEDWRNREKWPDYEQAVHDMVMRTSTDYAPWTLVAGNQKLYARIQILKTFCERLAARLE